MIKVLIFILSVINVFSISTVYSQTDSIVKTNIKYYDLDIEVTSNVSNYFTGNVTVRKKGVDVYRMDSSFSSYIEHRFIDLNGDGSKELLLSLSEGASPYVFNMLYIFDVNKDVKPLFMAQNGDVDTTSGVTPKILVNARMSPSVMGLWYFWYLEYRNGKLVYWKPDEKNKTKLRPDIASIEYDLKDYYKGKETCEDNIYSVFFENVFIRYKLSGEDYLAEEFFNKNYKCEDKVKALKNYKSTASDTYSWIKDEKNYIYSEF